MIKSKPAALPLYYASTHSLMAVVVLTVEVTLPATPPAVSSGKSATLRLPLSIINGGVLQTHAAELPRGRACPVCSQLNRAGQRGGSGSSVPQPAVCARASSQTSSSSLRSPRLPTAGLNFDVAVRLDQTSGLLKLPL